MRLLNITVELVSGLTETYEARWLFDKGDSWEIAISDDHRIMIPKTSVARLTKKGKEAYFGHGKYDGEE